MVDEAAAIGGAAERRGDERGEARGLDLVAVRGEAFEAVPQAGERPHLFAETQRVRVAALRQLG